MLPVFRTGVQGPLYQGSSNIMWHLQQKFILETNFPHIYVLNHIFLPSNILCISFCTTACKIKTKRINTIFWLQLSLLIELFLKKVEKIILKIWLQNVPSSVKVESFFFCSVIQGLTLFCELRLCHSEANFIPVLDRCTEHFLIRWEISNKWL
jgi:hypothetical protein